jgi:GTPase
VESFKSTLDEVREADLLLHVIDISHPGFEEQVGCCECHPEGTGSLNKPTILVFNKTDLFSFTRKDEDDLTPLKRENLSLDDLRRRHGWPGLVTSTQFSSQPKSVIILRS